MNFRVIVRTGVSWIWLGAGLFGAGVLWAAGLPRLLRRRWGRRVHSRDASAAEHTLNVRRLPSACQRGAKKQLESELGNELGNALRSASPRSRTRHVTRPFRDVTPVRPEHPSIDSYVMSELWESLSDDSTLACDRAHTGSAHRRTPVPPCSTPVHPDAPRTRLRARDTVPPLADRARRGRGRPGPIRAVGSYVPASRAAAATHRTRRCLRGSGLRPGPRASPGRSAPFQAGHRCRHLRSTRCPGPREPAPVLRQHRCHDVHVACADLATWSIPDDVTYAYVFNAVTDDVFHSMLERILDSLQRRPRRLVLIYANPVMSDLLLATRRFALVRTSRGLRRDKPDHTVRVFEAR